MGFGPRLHPPTLQNWKNSETQNQKYNSHGTKTQNMTHLMWDIAIHTLRARPNHRCAPPRVLSIHVGELVRAWGEAALLMLEDLRRERRQSGGADIALRWIVSWARGVVFCGCVAFSDHQKQLYHGNVQGREC